MNTIDFTPSTGASTASPGVPKIDFTPDKVDSNSAAVSLGHSTGLLGNILSTGGAIAGGLGGAALGGLAGIETGPGAIGTGYLGGVAGAGLGAAGGEALAQKIEGLPTDVGSIVQTGSGSAALEAIGGPLLSAGGKLLGKVAQPIVSAIGKGAAKVGEMFGGKQVGEAALETAKKYPVNVATSRIASTGETLTKAEREAAIKEGRMTAGGKYTPSKTEQRAGEILKGKTYSNPVKTVQSVQSEIATRGKEAETYLEKNATKISNTEDYNAFQTVKSNAEKYMTPAESSAYNEQIGVFQKMLKSYTGEGGYTTANYYKALKDYESQVTANLPKGKDALLVPGGSARVQAAKDVRSVVRNMIGEKNPDFKGKMYDLASLYDALDNVVAKAEAGGHKFSKRYPKTMAVLTTAGGVAGYEEAKKYLPFLP